jgi:CHAT domain-containing protein
MEPADRLAAILIDPLVEQGWLEDSTQLYLVPHGDLNYLPFALLPARDGEQRFLIDNHTLTYLPTAAALTVDGKAASEEQALLAMAPSVSRLRYAPAEARSVDALFQPNSRLFVGKSATESRFKEMAGEFQVLHLATHGYFNKLNPMFSGIRLEADEADDGLLEVHEIFNLELDADLVTLSACETALGGGFFAEVPAGDEFVGLTRAFLTVGSDAVLATLWEVDDRSSVDLMKNFYERLVINGADNDKSAALATAQQQLRSVDAYRHPYYWAPFILIGNTGESVHPQKTVLEAAL